MIRKEHQLQFDNLNSQDKSLDEYFLKRHQEQLEDKTWVVVAGIVVIFCAIANLL